MITTHNNCRTLTHPRWSCGSLVAVYVRNVRAIGGRNKACTTASRIADVLTGWAPAAFETVAFAGSVVAYAAIGAIDVTFVARHAHHVDLCGQQHIRHIAHENDSEADLSLTSRVLRETLAVFLVSGRVRVISTGTMAYKVIRQCKASITIPIVIHSAGNNTKRTQRAIGSEVFR